MNQVDRFNLDPQVDLEVEGLLIPQVVVDFESQVNILPKSTWLKPWLTSAHQVQLLPKTCRSRVSGTLGNLETRRDHHNGNLNQN